MIDIPLNSKELSISNLIGMDDCSPDPLIRNSRNLRMFRWNGQLVMCVRLLHVQA